MQKSRQCQGVPCFPTRHRNNACDSLATSHAVLQMKTITVQLLLWFASLHQTGNDLQEDWTTRGSETLSQIWDHCTFLRMEEGSLLRTLWTDTAMLQKNMPRREREVTSGCLSVRRVMSIHSGSDVQLVCCLMAINWLCLQCLCLQCFDAVGWAAGRASGL